MGDNWRQHFTVDKTNGVPGHELKFTDRQLVGSYLRVGHHLDGTWRNYKMRQDFIPAAKVQMEDDITASVVVPREQIKGLPEADYSRYPSLKIAENCEWRLFQRPDDAVYPGFDKQTEIDMAGGGLFWYVCGFGCDGTNRQRSLISHILDRFNHFLVPTSSPSLAARKWNS